MHMLSWLSTSGTAAIVEFPGVLYRGGNKNKLSEENRARILEAYTHRDDSEYFAQLVSNQAIGENDYNIAVSSYVEQEDTREVVNITELNQEIAQIVSKQNELRISIDAIVADIEGA
jgi:type I restriction enzyme M protein